MAALQATIIPYQHHHQSGVDLLMAMISKEFPDPIAAPQSKEKRESTQLPGHYWVALINEQVAGTIALSLVKKDTIALKRMFLHRDFRGHGIALLLLNTVIKWANDNRIAFIYLGTMTQFKAAQRFYEKNGFKRILQGELPEEFPVNPVDDLFYKKELTDLQEDKY